MKNSKIILLRNVILTMVVTLLLPRSGLANGLAEAPIVTMAKVFAQKGEWSKKIVELSNGTNTVSNPNIDVSQVLTQFEQLNQNSLDALHQCENVGFVQFKFFDSRAKIAIARSALSRAITTALSRGTVSSEATQRIDGLTAVLDEVFELLGGE